MGKSDWEEGRIFYEVGEKSSLSVVWEDRMTIVSHLQGRR